MSDLEKALGIVAGHFPLAPPEVAHAFAKRIEFAADLRKTAVPVDARNAIRLDDIKRIELRELNRLFAAGYPDVMEDFRQMVWRELRLANAAGALKGKLGPPDHVLVKALKGVYRDGSGKEPGVAADRVTGRVVPNKFTNFVSDVFRAFCDGESPSLDTIRRGLAHHGQK
jgi:hypothetical protein